MLWFAQGVPLANVCTEDPVQEHVEFADPPGAQVHLLTEPLKFCWVLSVIRQVV